jgi:hypothetical protein
MTLEKFIVTFILLASVAFVAITWRESRTDRTRLESAIASQQQLISAAENREKTRDATLKITLAQIADAKKAAQTPAQILSAVNQSLGLPQPISFTPRSTCTAPDESGLGTGETAFSRNSSSNIESHVLNFFRRRAQSSTEVVASQNPSPSSPTAPTDATAASSETAAVPASDLKPLFDQIQECRSCQAQLSAIQADLADEHNRAASLIKERDAAVKSAKGGNLWYRLRQNAKWLAVGAALSLGVGRIR